MHAISLLLADITCEEVVAPLLCAVVVFAVAYLEIKKPRDPFQ
jgi:hypothetical protein